MDWDDVFGVLLGRRSAGGGVGGGGVHIQPARTVEMRAYSNGGGFHIQHAKIYVRIHFQAVDLFILSL